MAGPWPGIVVGSDLSAGSSSAVGCSGARLAICGSGKVVAGAICGAICSGGSPGAATIVGDTAEAYAIGGIVGGRVDAGLGRSTAVGGRDAARGRARGAGGGRVLGRLSGVIMRSGV